MRAGRLFGDRGRPEISRAAGTPGARDTPARPDRRRRQAAGEPGSPAAPRFQALPACAPPDCARRALRVPSGSIPAGRRPPFETGPPAGRSEQGRGVFRIDDSLNETSARETQEESRAEGPTGGRSGKKGAPRCVRSTGPEAHLLGIHQRSGAKRSTDRAAPAVGATSALRLGSPAREACRRRRNGEIR